jgi:hypothetical protein
MKPLAWIALLGMTSALTIASCNNDQNPAQKYGDTLVQPLKSAKKLDATLMSLKLKIYPGVLRGERSISADLNELSTFNGMTLKSDQFDMIHHGNLTEKR